MRSSTKLVTSFAIMVLGVIWAAYVLWQDNSAREIAFTINKVFSLLFIVNAIVEVNESDQIDRKQKTMWTFGFVIGPLLTGLIYLLAERRRIISNR